MSHKEDKRLKDLQARNREIYEHSGNFSPIEIIKSGKAQKYSSKREIKGYILLGVAALAVITLIIVFILMFFKVKNITVMNEEDFSSEAVIAASGIRYGNNTVFLDKSKAVSSIASAIPYAENIKIRKILPSGIKIYLEKGEGSYYTAIGEDYYILSKDSRVIEKTRDIESIELSGCIRLQSSKISNCIMGKKIEYRDIDMQKIFDELVYLLEKYNIYGFCNDIILDSKFDIKFLFKERYTVCLGDLYDLEIKFQFFDKIVETLSENASGVINVSDPNLHEAIVTLYN